LRIKEKLSKLERGEDLLRAIKWWRKGSLEEDKVDKFLDYYIALEMLASIRGYKDDKVKVAVVLTSRVVYLPFTTYHVALGLLVGFSSRRELIG